MQVCSSCKAANESDEEVCFKCGRGLSGIKEGSLISGRYLIQSRLGRGGMGVVYLARDQELDEVVALKVLRSDAASPDLAKRFRSEIKLARRVSHRNVCRMYEFGKEGHVAYIVMEYVPGSDYKHILKERGRLPPTEAYDIAIQVAEALQSIHDEGIVHRDLKTPNIMCDAQGAVKVMDFGIAKSFESITTGATGTGHVVGTPEYMSPEQARAAPLDGRSDIYALGIVVFELFTGCVPFRADTPIATLFLHIQSPPPLESAGLPAALVPVLAKALAKAPVDRYQTAQELAEALRQAQAQLPGGTVMNASALPVATPDERETRPFPTASRAQNVTLPRRRIDASPRPSAPRTRAAPYRSSRHRIFLATIVGALVAGIALVLAMFLLQAPKAREGVEPTDSTVRASLQPTSPLLVAPATSMVQAAPPVSATSASPTSVEVPPSTQRSPNRPSPVFTPMRAPSTRTHTAQTPMPSASAPPPTTLVAAQPPERQSAVTPASGTLQIHVVPWAEVEVDGVKVGTSPPLRPLSLSEGVHAVKLTHPDYLPFPRRVTIRPGVVTRLQVDLTKEAFPK